MMKRSISLFFVILLGLVACGDETPQQIIITLTTAEGEVSTYEVNIAEHDTTAPEIIFSYPKNDVEPFDPIDPEDLNKRGITVVFSEPVTGNLMLLDGDDHVSWWTSKTDSHTITLTNTFQFHLLSHETYYTIQGIVADKAGNEAMVYIGFATSPLP